MTTREQIKTLGDVLFEADADLAPVPARKEEQ
jgi:hypothetical protein